MSCKKFRLLLILCGTVPVLFTGMCAAAEPFAGRIYTVEKSIRDALRNNHAVLYAAEEIKFAESRVREANSLVYPLVELQSSATRFNVQELYPLSTEVGTVLLDPSMDNSKTFLTAKATMKQLIYGGGRVLSTIRLARAFLDKAKSQYDEIYNKVVMDVKICFNEVILLKERAVLLEEAYVKILKLTELNKDRVSGAVLLEMLLEVSDLRMRIDEVSRKRNFAEMDFIQTLNIEHDVPLMFDGKLEHVESRIELNKCMAWAGEFRPELRRTQFQEQIDSLVVNLSISERQPQIMFGTTYEFSGLSFPLDEENWTATVSLKLPIFDGWAQWSKIRQKKAQARQGKLNQSRIRDEVFIQVRKTYSDYFARVNELEKFRNEKYEMEKIIGRIERSGGGTGEDALAQIRLIKRRYGLREKKLMLVFEVQRARINLEYEIGRSLDN